MNFYEMWERWFVDTLAQTIKANQQRQVEAERVAAEKKRETDAAHNRGQ